MSSTQGIQKFPWQPREKKRKPKSLVRLRTRPRKLNSVAPVPTGKREPHIHVGKTGAFELET